MELMPLVRSSAERRLAPASPTLGRLEGRTAEAGSSREAEPQPDSIALLQPIEEPARRAGVRDAFTVPRYEGYQVVDPDNVIRAMAFEPDVPAGYDVIGLSDKQKEHFETFMRSQTAKSRFSSSATLDALQTEMASHCAQALMSARQADALIGHLSSYVRSKSKEHWNAAVAHTTACAIGGLASSASGVTSLSLGRAAMNTLDTMDSLSATNGHAAGTALAEFGGSAVAGLAGFTIELGSLAYGIDGVAAAISAYKYRSLATALGKRFPEGDAMV